MVNIAAQVEGPTNVRRVFRMLVRQAKRLPVSVSNSALEELRQSFRTGGGGTGSEPDTAEILRRAEDRLGFMKIVTRKEMRDETSQKGVQTFVYGNTQKAQSTSSRKPLSNWSGNNLDPDCVSIHKQTLNRAGFSNHDQECYCGRRHEYNEGVVFTIESFSLFFYPVSFRKMAEFCLLKSSRNRIMSK